MMGITEESAYIATLDQFKGIGSQSILRIVKAFPSIDLLQQASPSQLEEVIGKRSTASLHSHLDHWSEHYENTLESLSRSAEKGILALPITSEAYPPLLKLIYDPPPMLYVEGDITLLKHFQTVAIVGTREPTERGREIAYAFAQRWARSDYVVVSGLAKGTDTAAHLGTLDAHGKTIAVLGTPLDKVYPAENKALARRIVDNGGLLLSELMIGHANFKSAFVARDRLQSGLSVCVFPVQTTLDGGTMHTARFAEKQGRFLICLRPAQGEESARQYEGIWALIHEKEGRKQALDPMREDHFERCLQAFPLRLKKLLRETPGAFKENEITPSPDEQKSIIGLWDTLGGTVSRLREAIDTSRDEKQISRALEALGLDSQGDRFMAEVYHLVALFHQGQTIAQALATVDDRQLRQELTPFMYCAELSALVFAARDLHGLTAEQAEDFQAFLRQIAGIGE
ncbi:MAG TPA: DNA-processing protein DprA [Ktedonobacteraceae bacterium]|jgi:DNA processing protein